MRTIEPPRPADLPALAALWREAFDDCDEAFLHDFFRYGFAPDRCRCVRAEGRIAAMVNWFWYGDAAYLYGVATAADFRRQGLCRMLLADTCKVLAAAGASSAVLIPANGELARAYGTMGFAPIPEMALRRMRAGEKTAALTPLPWRDYREKSRALVPRAVNFPDPRHDGFAECQFAAFSGDGFTLAADRAALAAGTLENVVLLGNPAAGPGILAALGVPEGTFTLCAPGPGTAMGRRLTGQGAVPPFFPAFG